MEKLFLSLLFLCIGATAYRLCSAQAMSPNARSLATFAFSFLVAISLAVLLASCKIVRRAGGVVHNPRPDSLVNPCSKDEIQIVRVTDPGESGMNKGDKVAAINAELDSLCNGDTVEVNIKKGKSTNVGGKKMQSAKLLSHKRNKD